MNRFGKMLLGGFMSLAMAGSASAACVAITDNIDTSTTWTADYCYDLQNQIYVLPGATLTIEAGTVIASTATVNGSGSLAVTRDARIYVNGTAEAPVIMTSSIDVYGDGGSYLGWDVDATNPTGRDPKSGEWHVGANEWGNLTMMGNGIIGYSYNSQPATPDALSEADMEGLIAVPGFEDQIKYGGLDDDDNSGSISYLSIRYGGRVVGLANELNGLSLGAIGRGTDINHVEIMNNVDDGIEIWGGTVNLKYVSIWNIGDDSFDVDQGWRGKAQFGLIVQGYSVDADQGSGVGDNCFETDGAEDAATQPRTTAKIYNFTVIGNPNDGDYGTAWRDNARLQYRNMVFMDLGDKLVKNDVTDGEGAQGYGYLGTHTFADIWTTDYNVYPTLNIGSADPTVLYQSQTDGKLAEIKDSVFYNLPYLGDAPVNLLSGYDNVTGSGSPVKLLTRSVTPFVSSGQSKVVYPVLSLDPRAQNEAATSVAMAPVDGFYTPAPFRGGFSPNNNWLAGWTAADAYGMTVTTNNATDPDTTVELVGTVLTFDTLSGVVYAVEESSDGVSYAPFATVTGDGTAKTVSNLAGFDSAKLYRVIAL